MFLLLFRFKGPGTYTLKQKFILVIETVCFSTQKNYKTYEEDLVTCSDIFRHIFQEHRSLRGSSNRRRMRSHLSPKWTFTLYRLILFLDTANAPGPFELILLFFFLVHPIYFRNTLLYVTITPGMRGLHRTNYFGSKNYFNAFRLCMYVYMFARAACSK